MNPGGAQEAILRLTRALKRRGHDVELWCLYDKTPLGDNPDQVKVLLEAENPGAGAYAQILSRTISALRHHRPDAVISFLPLACVVGQVAAKIAGVPIRIASQRNPGWSYGTAMEWADKIAGSLGFYTLNVANSRAVESSFSGYPASYRKRIEIVYNGIAWKGSSLTQDQAKAKFGLCDDQFNIVSVGRLSDQKNHAVMLRALAQTTGIGLVLAGDGELREDLEAQCATLQISDRVLFLGDVKPKDIPDLLQASDAFALSSRYEGQSNALLEAMNAGRPILASDIPPQAETLVEEGQEPAGRLLPVEDDKAWAKAMQDLAENPALRQDLAERALARVVFFTPERSADGFERLLVQSAQDLDLPSADSERTAAQS